MSYLVLRQKSLRPQTNRKSNMKTQNAAKNFAYTTIAGGLKTVSLSNDNWWDSSWKNRQKSRKVLLKWSQKLAHKQVPKGTEQGAWKGCVPC